MAAYELARRDVSVRVVDRAPQRSPQSRALVIHARTLETFDLAGLADVFLARGYPSPGLNVGLGGENKPISVDMRVLDTRYPMMLVLPQRDTEEILTDALKSYGPQTEWNSALTHIEQSDDGVAATIDTGESPSELIQASYLVGCDGAHSTVRRLVNLAFEGEQHSEIVLLGDVKVDRVFVRSRITNFTSPRGFLSILPFLGDYVRVFAVDFAHQDHNRTEELTLEELQDTVNAIAPRPIRLREPRWLTRYVAPSRQVRTTRAGRVFLAGDAAHAHSPAGGQGMNTGLQDAANLGWKLAMVLRGHAGAELLDTYDQERSSVHAAARHGTDQMFRTFTLRNPALKVARDIAARLAVPRGFVQRRLAQSLSGLGVNYRHTPRARAANTSRGLSHEALRAGQRVPDMPLWQPHQGLVRLYEVMRQPGYTLVVCATADRITNARPQIDRLISDVGKGGEYLQCVLVIDEGAIEDTEIGAPVLVDITRSFAKKMGTVHGSVVLIRPDGYIAAHRPDFDPAVIPLESPPAHGNSDSPADSDSRLQRKGVRS
jgi:2-polyprenyl-6-methoxyphenol hydroxylase-like FAD-dependent oxidoreductase